MRASLLWRLFTRNKKNDSAQYDDDDDDAKKRIEKSINQINHKHCLKVDDALKCKNVGDYRITDLHCDVLFLADVVDNFRKTFTESFGLNPLLY